MPILTNQASRFIGGGRITPDQIFGLQLWLKADAITGLSDGDALTTWADSSGNACNPTQADAALKPVYKTGILNSLPVVRFDADYLTIASSTATFKFLHTAQATIFAVASFGSGANPDAVYGVIGTSGLATTAHGIALAYDDRAAQTRSNALVCSITRGASGAATASILHQDVITPQQAIIESVVIDVAAAAASRIIARINGGTALAGNVLTNAASTDDATRNFQVGAYGNNGGPLVGDVAEIIIYNSALSDANRQAVEAYLSSKYGIALA